MSAVRYDRAQIVEWLGVTRWPRARATLARCRSPHGVTARSPARCREPSADLTWNPVAENQATDRAHRIGQTKPVFVYKLVAAGSIEEQILALQARKAALADLILSDDPGNGVRFASRDLEALFAPLPSLSASA